MPYLTLSDQRRIHYTDTPPKSPSSTITTADDKAPPTATTIIFVHGLGSTENYFFPIFPHLPTYRLLTFDNYGAGRSALVPAAPATSVALIAADALSLLDHLAVRDPVVVVGYSMGGMVPTHLAATAPARVRAAVCIGPVHPTPQVADVFAQRIPKVRGGGMEVMADSVPDAATGKGANAAQKAFIREMLLSQEVEGYVANCRAIMEAAPPEYGAVTCPVLIVAGDEDKSAPVAGCEGIFDRLGTDKGKKKLTVLKGVGHWYCVEDPDKVGREVSGWLGEMGLA